MKPFDLKGKLILADKGYDSDQFVRSGSWSFPVASTQSIHQLEHF